MQNCSFTPCTSLWQIRLLQQRSIPCCGWPLASTAVCPQRRRSPGSQEAEIWTHHCNNTCWFPVDQRTVFELIQAYNINLHDCRLFSASVRHHTQSSLIRDSWWPLCSRFLCLVLCRETSYRLHSNSRHSLLTSFADNSRHSYSARATQE